MNWRVINQHKVKKVFQRKTYDDFIIFFQNLFRKDLNVTIPPTCGAKACEFEHLAVADCPAE